MGILKKQYVQFIVCILCFVCLVIPQSYAYFDFIRNGYDDSVFFNQDEGPGAELDRGGSTRPDEYIYEDPSITALSHMYWAVNLYSINDKKALDEFMRINECEMFLAYSNDELEWKGVRTATSDFIKANKTDFPLRFRFVVPLQLVDYDFERGVFEVDEKSRVVSSRRFQLYSTDIDSRPCSAGKVNKWGAYSYPRVLEVEFSRPFTLTSIPMTKEVANAYIKEKVEIWRQLSDRYRNRRNMLALRTAYLHLNIKMSTHGRLLAYDRKLDSSAVQMVGVLEGYAIYSDKDATNLFYEQNYVVKKDRKKSTEALAEEYNILKVKSEGDGVLY